MPETSDDAQLWSLYGRLGAYESWKRTEDRATRTAPARRAFDRRFDDEVDPRRELTEVERTRRAEFARKAYFQRLALKSAQARRRRRTESERVTP